MKLAIKRTGGIAGLTMAGQLDTGELPPDAADAAERALRELAGHAPAGPPPPDGFRYEIAPLDGGDDLEPIVIDERDLPDALRGPVGAAARAGEPERR